jgi:hypothetical protein
MMNTSAEPYLPADIVLHPNWWNKEYGLTFDEDFFYLPQRRVEQEQRMRQLLYERFGDLGLGQKDAPRRPIIGPILMGSGYIIQEILGCEILYKEDSNPWVVPRAMSEAEVAALRAPERIEDTRPMRRLLNLTDALEREFGYVQGDVPLHGLANASIDLRGNDYFIDLLENPPLVEHLHAVIRETIRQAAMLIRNRTGSTSISVNRTIASFDRGIHILPNCSMQMIGPNLYEQHFLPHDLALADTLRPIGYHHCGNNAHLYAPLYARAGAVYLDVGCGSDIARCRQALPEAWLGLRIDPVKMLKATPADARAEVRRLLEAHGAPYRRVGVCCINMDYGTADETIRALLETVAEYRGNRDSGIRQAYSCA